MLGGLLVKMVQSAGFLVPTRRAMRGIRSIRIVMVTALTLLGLAVVPQYASARDVALYCQEVVKSYRWWTYIPENIASPASFCWWGGFEWYEPADHGTRLKIMCFANETSIGPGQPRSATGGWAEAEILIKDPIPPGGLPPETWDWFKKPTNWGSASSSVAQRCAAAFP